MDRIVVHRSATLSRTFAFTPTGTPTVALTRVSDGTPVTASVMSGSGTDWAYTIPASSNTLLDTYAETVTATSGGEPQVFTEYIEVAGDLLFTVAEARALRPLDSTTNYTTAQIVAMRTTVEQALEDACGVAFVPRYTRETLSSTGGVLALRWPKIRAIRSASYTSGGVTTALTVGELALLSYADWGGITGYTWGAGYGNVTVGYEHGYDRPPEEVRRAALILARHWLTGASRPVDDRAITFNAGQEGGTYSLAVPGRNGSVFGMPDVDAVVQRYSLIVGVA